MAHVGVSRPFVLFVSSAVALQECDGLLRAWKLIRHELRGRQLVIVGAERDQQYCGRAAPAGRRARHRRRRRLRRWCAERGDGPLLPGGRPPGLPLVQRDLRVADPRSDGVRLPGRHVQRQLDARDRGRSSPSWPTLTIRARSLARSLRPSASAASRLRTDGLRRAQRVHLGCDRRRRRWTSTARPPSARRTVTE